MRDSLQIRLAVQDDIPSIVSLLRLSLGESLMPKSEQFWRWKHIDNPFGPSPVLLAFDGHLLVGVRAFMRWEWKVSGKIVTAVRAVDTATHPRYQGRGIFTSLTLKLIKQCEHEGVGFIFNTPNKKSKPGYLKMGWESLGKLKVFCAPKLPFGGRGEAARSIPELGQATVQHVVANVPDDGMAKTNCTYDYLKWRYHDNPNASYSVFCDTVDNWLLIYRIKPIVIGKEFRVVDFFATDRPNAFKAARTKMAGAGASIVTIAGHKPDGFMGLNMGPEVTVRNVTMAPFNFQTWSPSLGDLELF